jgi:hypothetical protein
MVRFILRVTLVALAMALALPYVAGIQFHGDWLGAVSTSLVFNVAFLGLEWLLGIIVFGINLGTLGLGVIITSGIKFIATLLAPSIALIGTAKLMPHFLSVSDYYPAALIAGLTLGGLLWTTSPEKKKK